MGRAARGPRAQCERRSRSPARHFDGTAPVERGGRRPPDVRQFGGGGAPRRRTLPERHNDRPQRRHGGRPVPDSRPVPGRGVDVNHRRVRGPVHGRLSTNVRVRFRGRSRSERNRQRDAAPFWRLLRNLALRRRNRVCTLFASPKWCSSVVVDRSDLTSSMPVSLLATTDSTCATFSWRCPGAVP